MFGVCGNELSADGHVVDKQYGCGAHSDTPAPAGSGSPRYEAFNDGVLDGLKLIGFAVWLRAKRQAEIVTVETAYPDVATRSEAAVPDRLDNAAALRHAGQRKNR